jgi:uncharacterized repeat protein (TIGR01451 family)
MLAKYKPFLVTCGLALSLTWNAQLFGQTNAPSRNANPVPPSVHVPPKQSNGGNSFNFSDTGVRGGDTAVRDKNVQLAAFLQDSNQEPQVPALLAGQDKLLPPSQALEIAKNKMVENTDPNSIRKSNEKSLSANPTTQKPAGEPAVQKPQLKQPAVLQKETGPQVVSDEELQRQATLNRIRQAELSHDAKKSTGQDMSKGQRIEASPPASSNMPVNFETNAKTNSTSRESKILNFGTPSIEIESFGPQSVGIHKRSQYKVIVRNTSGNDADNLSVSVNLPQWVKLENVNTSVGRREIGTEQRAARVRWTIDRLSAGTSQTMTLDAIPTKAENFDVQVEWAIQPRATSARVQVTEPRLDMNISGPTEVMYGETAMYQVTVRNPGTGTAENVTVMLPEALGGERASLGEIPAGQERAFQVELLARAAGQLDLTTSATGAGDLQTSSTREIVVRRPALALKITGPQLKYAGSVGQYDITITNNGDAIARDVSAALALPTGVQYVDGIDGAELIDNAMRWTIGTLDVGDKRTYRVNCQLNSEGEIQMDLGARGSSDIAAVDRCLTTVETVADLILTVDDPKGPLPTGQKLEYTIRVKNRGSRAANDLNLIMQYSEGVEPTIANGLTHQVVPGQVVFSPIPVIEPGQEISVVITAQALTAGVHRFRAQLSTEDGDVHEVKEGTTKFYGDNIAPTTTARAPTSNDFKK